MFFFEKAREEQEKAGEQRKALVRGMENAAEFIRESFGENQELIVFFTGLTEHSVCGGVLKKELPDLQARAEELLGADAREEELRRKLLG